MPIEISLAEPELILKKYVSRFYDLVPVLVHIGSAILKVECAVTDL